MDDTFLRCFKSPPNEPWNWNVYLWPAWALGVLVRNLILFPLRLVFILLAFLLFVISFASVDAFVRDERIKRRAFRRLSQYLAQSYVASWSGVVKFHGPAPVPGPGRVYVCNHTSMIDYALLCSFTPFAAIMQLHPGWVGVLQRKYLKNLGCLYFDRTQARDRALVARKMREHVQNKDVSPLLIFPEGTCVNNEYCVMFKRGAFDLGAVVCPIAIRYNKAFANAFWNSKRQSFSAHLISLMRSWALVADVYFLEPQTRRPNESAQDFATRVQRVIADAAGLRIAPWDGYLKYYNLAEKHPDLIEKQRARYSESLHTFLDRTPRAVSSSGDDEPAPAKATKKTLRAQELSLSP